MKTESGLVAVAWLYYNESGLLKVDHLLPHTDGAFPVVRLSDAETIIAQKDAEIERLSLYKNLAAEYGLSVFADLSNQSAALKLAKTALTDWLTTSRRTTVLASPRRHRRSHAGGQAMSFDLEDAGYWSSPEQCDAANEIVTLRNQVEKLTQERDEAVAAVQRLADGQPFDAIVVADTVKRQTKRLEQQLAALAEQNEKMKDALKTVVDDAEECTDHDDWTAMLLSLDAYHIASTCIEEINELTDLATPVLNRIRAEGMREAEKIVRKRVQWVSNGRGIQYRSTAPESISAESLADAIRARADELEKSNGL